MRENELNKQKTGKIFKRIFLFTSRDDPMTKTSFAKAVQKLTSSEQTTSDFDVLGNKMNNSLKVTLFFNDYLLEF